jgi:hypothetical protein
VKRLALITYGVCQFVLFGWWIAFYPGTLSYDSVMYTWQVSTSNWTTQHSVLYNALVWLSLQTTGQLALLTLAQTVAMAAGLAYAVTGLARLGVRGRWLALAAVAAVCVPAVGTFTVYVSKDVAFVLCQVFLLGTLARFVVHRQSPSRGLWLALGGELVLMGLFRQNGFLVIAITVGLLAVILTGLWWRVLAAGVVAIVVAFLANIVVYPALGVRSAGSELLLGPAYADIAVAYADRPGMFTKADKGLMASVAPLSFWSSSANCYIADSTVSYTGPFNIAEAARRHSELFDLWLRLVKRMPDEITQTRLCRGSIAWNPFPGPARGRTIKIPIAGVSTYFDFPPERLAQSPYAGAIRSAPLSPTAHEAAVWLRRLSDTRSFEWFAWRGATWSYVAYLAVLLFARRRREWAALALVTVTVANQITVLVNNPNQLVRYMMGPMVLGILLLPLAFAGRAGSSEARHPAELAVAGVAEPGDDEGPVVEPVVDRGGDQPDRQAGRVEPRDPLRRGEDADDGDVGAPALGDQPYAVFERPTGSQHRVQDHDRDAGQVGR